MAISKIKKVEILGLQRDKEGLLSVLQNLGCVELISQEAAALPSVSNEEVSLSEVEEAIAYLGSFTEKTGLIGGMVALKPLFFEEQLKEAIAGFNYQSLLQELTELRAHLKNLGLQKEKLAQERQLLVPWRRLNIPLEQIRPTLNCGFLLGALSSRDYALLMQDCAKEDIQLSCETVSQDKSNTYMVILYLKDEFERMEAVLKAHRFNFITLTRHPSTVKDRLLEINFEILLLDDEIEDTQEKIHAQAKERFKLMVIYDNLAIIARRQEAQKDIAQQQFTFSLSGWIKAKDIKLLEAKISAHFQDVVLFISEPEGAQVPVDLENNPLIQPFEFITRIYGMPQYNEIDPTPYLAPFFFIYFGLCVSDVGYGLILMAASWFALKKFKMGPQGLKFFRLFFFCGISTVIVGALTGGWFGNLFDLLAESNTMFVSLKKFKDNLIILDPMQEPTKLLGVALSFGILQVWFGNIVAGIGNVKNKRYLYLLYDQLPMLIFLFGLTGLGLIFLKLIPSTRLNIFKLAALSAAGILILTQGRSEKGIGPKLFYGAYNLYSALSGYLSDILSYSRLWALGLVTGVMAATINLISVQFSQILVSVIPFINNLWLVKIILSSLILILIFIFGHLVSFLMNLLGAFVHPLRLQFVEFFSKFFKSGGKTFRPFKVETKYINIG